MIYENGALSKILTDEGYITLSGTTPTYHYYLKDHLGNNRVVLNQNGTTVEQVNHYYPFGGLFDQTSETLQAYKYNGKGLDRTYGIDLYDYSARFMDGAVGRFTTMDPLSEKYYSISPYGYVMNNPMKFVDPDGRKVYFAPGVSDNFKKNFAASVQHLNKHGAAGMLAELEKSDKAYYIEESPDGSSKFDPNRNTIVWASEYGILTNEGVTLSATSVLNHEVDHALQRDKNPEQQKKDSKEDESNPYVTKEDERVITGSEQKTAKKLKEIKEGEVTRKDHYGTPYKMKDSTSTEFEDEPTVKAKRN